MKKIDKDGLLLSNLQGEIFEKSLTNTNCSSEIFIRRFMNSNISNDFDSKALLDQTLTIKDIFTSLKEQYGESKYGKISYTKDELFWIGYLYRYWCYTYDMSSKQVYHIIKPKELRELFLPYHTLDCCLAISRILEYKNISFDEDDMIAKGVELLRNIRKRKQSSSENI